MKFKDSLQAYKTKIIAELVQKCEEIVKIVREGCMARATDNEQKTFFEKMIADYYRYIAESATDEKLAEVKDGALKAYQAASALSAGLNPCNPICLGLALNYSVFHYESLQDKEKAIELGEKALGDALEKIDDVDEEMFRDAKSIIELLKENISLWKEEGDENQVDDL